jgi:hypothetical protein
LPLPILISGHLQLGLLPLHLSYDSDRVTRYAEWP